MKKVSQKYNHDLKTLSNNRESSSTTLTLFNLPTINLAYKQVHVSYNAALDYFSNKDEDANWIIPVVVSISNDLRLIAGLVSECSMLYCAMLCHTMLCYAMLYCAMPCYTMLSNAMPCYSMLCFDISRCQWISQKQFSAILIRCMLI